MRRLRLIVLLLVALTAPTLAACGGGDDPDTGPVSTVEAGEELTLSGEKTTLKIDGITGGVLKGGGVTVEAVAPATGKESSISIPVVGGQITSGTLAGAIEHEGGIAFVAGDKRIEYSDLKIDTVAGQVFSGPDGKTPVLDLDVRTLKRAEDGDAIVISDVVVLLATAAAEELNAGLEVTAFKPQQVIGKVTVRATGS